MTNPRLVKVQVGGYTFRHPSQDRQQQHQQATSSTRKPASATKMATTLGLKMNQSVSRQSERAPSSNLLSNRSKREASQQLPPQQAQA